VKGFPQRYEVVRDYGASRVTGGSTILDVHVFELAGFEDFPTFLALNEFGVFFTGDNLHAGVLTLIHFPSLGWGLEATGSES